MRWSELPEWRFASLLKSGAHKTKGQQQSLPAFSDLLG
jgi:hypothetical protein